MRAMVWVMDQKVGSLARKMVLLKLSENADEITGDCWPSVDVIADTCECSRRTVQRHLRELEDSGFIKTLARGGQAKDGRRYASRYRVIGEWPRPSGAGSHATPAAPLPAWASESPAGASESPAGASESRSNQSVNQSVNQKGSERKRSSPPVAPEELVEAYRNRLSFGQQIQKWTARRDRAMHKLLRDNPESAGEGFWDDYFSEVSGDPWCRGEVPPRDGRDPFKVTIDYLLQPDTYARFYERAMNRENRAA